LRFFTISPDLVLDNAYSAPVTNNFPDQYVLSDDGTIAVLLGETDGIAVEVVESGGEGSIVSFTDHYYGVVNAVSLVKTDIASAESTSYRLTLSMGIPYSDKTSTISFLICQNINPNLCGSNVCIPETFCVTANNTK
jgi:hypothetical protein